MHKFPKRFYQIVQKQTFVWIREAAKHIKHKTANLMAKVMTRSDFSFQISHFSSREGGVLLFCFESFWQSALFSDPRGTTPRCFAWPIAVRFTERGTSFLYKKRSTPFHKAILPTFTKQLRKNYTIIVPLTKHRQIYPLKI